MQIQSSVGHVVARLILRELKNGVDCSVAPLVINIKIINAFPQIALKKPFNASQTAPACREVPYVMDKCSAVMAPTNLAATKVPHSVTTPPIN